MTKSHSIKYDSSFRVLVGAAIACMSLVIVLVFYLLLESYKRYENNAAESSQNITLTLETFLIAHFQQIDLALHSAQVEFTKLQRENKFDRQVFSAYLETLHQRLTNVKSVRGGDQDGRVIYGEGVDLNKVQSQHDREYFLRAKTEGKIAFGIPVISRVTGEYLLPIAAPLTYPDGSFGGIAYANTEVKRLLEMLSSLKIGEHGVVALFDAQRRIMVRYPSPKALLTGQILTAKSPAIIAALAKKKSSATFHSRSALDGYARTVSYRQIGTYPVYVSVALAQADYLSPWKGEVAIGILFVLVLGLAMFLFIVTMRRYLQVEGQVQSMTATQVANDHLLAVLSAIPDQLFEVDVEGYCLEGPNRIPLEFVAALMKEPTRESQRERLSPEAAQVLRIALETAYSHGYAYGIQVRHVGEGGEQWFELSIARKDDHLGGDPTLIVLSRDITDRKCAQAQIEQLAFSDLLTQLPNRRLFLDRLRHSMATSQRSGKVCALLFLDLDRFKIVNDTLGHQFGDLLLVQIAQRLRNLVREGDTVARLGGDEFVVILEQLASTNEEAATQAMFVAEKIVAHLDDDFDLDGRIHHSTASIGVSLFCGQAVTVEELLRRADMSMYQAKGAGKNAVRFFDPETQASIEERLALEVELQKAVVNEEFILYYQPQIDVSGKCIGVEALIRWRNERRGFVAPNEFIPLAEDTGLILPIGHWVVGEACRQLSEWNKMEGFSEVVIAVNVSARQFSHPTFTKEVRELIEHYAIDPTMLKIELTESTLISKVEEAVAKMAELREMGINFSLDDFGTGFSSLSYLKRLPFSQLKIDQSFARDVLTDANDAAICRAIIALGHSLGLEVIAEGVETTEQWNFLKAAGCRRAQGYLIARPMPSKDFETWLQSSTQTQTETILVSADG